MNIKDTHIEIEQHNQTMKGLIDKIKNYILTLPDNPKINRLNKNCFVINSKDLGNNWSVGYHNFKKQYEYIVSELEKCKPDDVIDKLCRIIIDGKLHSDVITKLRKIINYEK